MVMPETSEKSHTRHLVLEKASRRTHPKLAILEKPWRTSRQTFQLGAEMVRDGLHLAMVGQIVADGQLLSVLDWIISAYSKTPREHFQTRWQRGASEFVEKSTRVALGVGYVGGDSQPTIRLRSCQAAAYAKTCQDIIFIQSRCRAKEPRSLACICTQIILLARPPRN